MTPWEIGGWALVIIATIATVAMLSFAVILIALIARVFRQIWRDEIKFWGDSK